MRVPVVVGRRFCLRIIGALGVLAVAAGLQGCSLLKIAYNQAPELAYRYLDGHLDLTGAQSLQLKGGLQEWQGWHRQTQLPAYIGALQQLQQQLAGDTSAAAACQVVADLRGKLDTASTRAEALAAALASSLSPQQLARLEEKFAEKNAEDRQDWLAPSAKTLQTKRYQRLLDRAESLYGRLDEAQRALMAQRLARSRFDAGLWLGEKQRRQRDTLQTLQPLAAGQASAAQALAALRGLRQRALQSPDPLYRSHLAQLTQESCETFALLHNSTTALQRNKAVQTLRRYEQDLKTLTADPA